ncbi:MAG: hypothetical protein OFPI_04060 [Osedax symbiont Rs2]|nr:MAG: hypothetical protein OFPI_04060 [Osedax symbiont Rs2]
MLVLQACCRINSQQANRQPLSQSHKLWMGFELSYNCS